MSARHDGMPFTGVQLEHYDECVRSIPAIIMARLGKRPHEAHVLYVGLEKDALEKGIDTGMAWSIFGVAAMAWLQQTWVALADAREEPVEELLRKAIASTVEWMTT